MAAELAPPLALAVPVFAAAGGDGGGNTCLPWLLVMVGGLGTGLMEMPLEKVAGLPLPATILTVGDTSMNAGDTCSAGQANSGQHSMPVHQCLCSEGLAPPWALPLAQQHRTRHSECLWGYRQTSTCKPT